MLDFWKGNGIQFVEMGIVGNDISGIGSDSAIHKLVVVHVAVYHIETKISVNENYIVKIQ